MMKYTEILGIIRHVLTFGGAIAIGFGWIAADQVDVVIEAVIGAIGAVAALVGVCWSVWNSIVAKRNLTPVEVNAILKDASENPAPGGPAMVGREGDGTYTRKIDLGYYYLVFNGRFWTRVKK